MLRKETPSEGYVGRQVFHALTGEPCQKVQFVEGREWIILMKNEITGECFEITVQGNIDPGAWDDESPSYDWNNPPKL